MEEQITSRRLLLYMYNDVVKINLIITGIYSELLTDIISRAVFSVKLCSVASEDWELLANGATLYADELSALVTVLLHKLPANLLLEAL